MPKIRTKKGEVKKNPLNLLSKFKILDNLRRSLVEIFVILTIIAISTYKLILGINIWPILTIMLITVLLPSILDLISYVVQKEDQKPLINTSQKQFHY